MSSGGSSRDGRFGFENLTELKVLWLWYMGVSYEYRYCVCESHRTFKNLNARATEPHRRISRLRLRSAA